MLLELEGKEGGSKVNARRCPNMPGVIFIEHVTIKYLVTILFCCLILNIDSSAVYYLI